MDSNKSSAQPNDPTQISKIQNIIDIISELQDNLSKAKPSAPKFIEDNHQNNNTHTNHGNDSADNKGGNTEKDGSKTSERNIRNASQPSLWPSFRFKKGKRISNQQKSDEKDARKSENGSNSQRSVENSSSKGNKNEKFHHSNRVDVDPSDQLAHDLIYMKNALTNLKKFEDDFSKPIEELKGNLKRILTQGSSGSDFAEQIGKIRKSCLNLKSKIPSARPIATMDSDALQDPQTNGSKELPNLCKDGNFKEHYFFQEFQKKFEGLDIPKRLCLLCFAVFPENAVINKRLLVYWWIGERLLDQRLIEKDKVKEKEKTAEKEKEKGKMAEKEKTPDKEKEKEKTADKEKEKENNADKGKEKTAEKDKEKEKMAEKEKESEKTAQEKKVKTAEEIADEIIQEFQAQRFIHSVDKKHRKVANSLKMYPHGCNRACLVYAKEGSIQERLEKVNGPNLNHEIRTLFNVSEKFPDFKSEWFAKMKSIRVLYLGRWRSSDEHAHIEVENTDYLKGLNNMSDLRLLSLQGISGIQELPSSISSLTSLRVLDLRACYNLEKLPHEIGMLKNLTHLDISECVMLDGMPKELCSLSQLQVFKGFAISDPKPGNRCTLDNLQENLTQLRKLSISINSANFPVDKLSTVVKFKELLELRVSWGGGSSKSKRIKAATLKRSVTRLPTFRNQSTIKPSDRTVNVGSKSKVQKLDLQCFPEEKLPTWLFPENLKNLETLYMRGGKLSSLGHCKWETVKVLRLKFLNELKINWKGVQELFPNLEYLEKFKCLKVTLCPCDGSGVWERTSKPGKQSNPNEEHES
ncbi:Disease resistance RPP13-like protein 4 [Melia azedarach]|uniref:Disease resistance RPP13-like protein 4 n=1 Tax=Melia azedarach TaxID=155640 RepID=A0ACC1YBT9_MELAZ|nr:Disease resistance RPP13-like protein 4 [Melia azedarach]